MPSRTKAPPPAAASAPSSGVVSSAASEPSETWHATERDWTLLERTPAVQVWKLAALACGVHPKANIGSHLPPALRERYEDLRTVVRGAASTSKKQGWLLCEATATNAGKADNLRATLLNFVEFLRAQTFAPHARMLEIAERIRTPHPGVPAPTSTAATPGSARRLESMAIRAKTLARILVPIMIEKYGLTIDFKNDYGTEFTISTVSGSYKAIAKAVFDAGLPEVHANTPRESIEFAIELLGAHVVRDAIKAYRHKTARDRGFAPKTDTPDAAPMD